MEPEESRLFERERLARDAQNDTTLLWNVLHFSLWTLATLIPTMILLLVGMPLVWRVILIVLCIVCWGFVIGGIFRLTGLLDEGSRPIVSAAYPQRTPRQVTARGGSTDHVENAEREKSK